jgi:hypothetical protein
MPARKPAIKLTGQQEHFAREYVRLGNASRAYRHAYNVREATRPETVWQEASKLVSHPKVSQRINELRALASERAVCSTADSIRDLTQTRELAMELEMPSAAVSAAAVRARIAGHMAPKRVELSGPGGAAIAVEEQVTIEDRSRYDFARRVAMLLAKGKGQLKLGKPAAE